MAESVTGRKAPAALPAREAFDAGSGPFLERLTFNNRRIYAALCVLVTAFLAYQASQLQVNASYEKMMPQSHDFVRNYQTYKQDLGFLGNTVRVVVENRNGDIYDPQYLAALREINDRIFLLPGVDRSFVKSLWMASVRWTAVTVEGFEGGPIIPADYDGSPESIDELRSNVERAGLVGDLVGLNQRSSMIIVPLLERDSSTGEQLDYKALTESLEEIESEFRDQGVELHIIGFAKLVGDLIQGLIQVLSYFLIAAVVVTLVTYWDARCLRSTAIVVACSLMGVVWQLGAMHLLGFVLDPYSVLVPFLIFAIGVSHGAQMMNGTIANIGRGAHRYVAARLGFRGIYLAGLAALLSDAAGFAVISVIDIPVIRDLALQASAGVAALIFTNLLLIPVLLSFTGISDKAAKRAGKETVGEHPVSRWFAKFAEPGTARVVLVATAVLTLGGLYVARGLQIGDVGTGAPELREDSEYNQDVRFISENYGLSNDLFAVIVTTPQWGIASFESAREMDRLEQRLRDLDVVQTTESVGSMARRFTPASFEGAPKWFTISRDPRLVFDAVNRVFTARPELVTQSRNVAPVIAYLTDHKAETLEEVVAVAGQFAEERSVEERQFLLAAGNAGIEAATNDVVARANVKMLLLVYGAVILLCGLAFRSWRAILVAVIPLVVVTVLAQALMTVLNIGVKVATLPVVALGVGIGVDYALYLLTVYLTHRNKGASPRASYMEALVSTGKVVALVGLTLTVAVATWIWAPIKFQSDMGVLLAFFFLGNMIAALTILPSLATFLLPQKKEASVRPAGQQAAAVAHQETI